MREAKAEAVLAIAAAVDTGDLDLDASTPEAFLSNHPERQPSEPVERADEAARQAPQSAGRTLEVSGTPSWQ